MPKIYRQHRCDRKHRKYNAMAKCIWPRAEWIVGEGPFASVAYCRVTTVELFADEDRAAAAKRMIDSTGCGGMCSKRHEIIELALPA